MHDDEEVAPELGRDGPEGLNDARLFRGHAEEVGAELQVSEGEEGQAEDQQEGQEGESRSASKDEGDAIEFQAPDGLKTYDILEVRYE